MRTDHDVSTISEQSLTTVRGGVTTIGDTLSAIRNSTFRSFQQGQAISAQIRNAQSAALARNFAQRRW